VLLSLEVYVLAPPLQQMLRDQAPMLDALITLISGATTFALLANLSVVLTSGFVCSIIFVVVLCPMWLLRMHKFKAQINGPWDEAVPKLGSILTDMIVSKSSQNICN
jgi:phosphatidylinositol N-acetylglucosaminyltransferase subunit C